VGALADPAAHIGKCYRPTGPDLLSARDIASILARVLRRKVKYQNVPIKMFVKAAIAQGFPLFEISQVRHYLEELRQGTFAIGAPTDHVLRVSGRPPEDFESMARRYVKEPQLIHPVLSIGTRLEAFMFMFRMLRTRAPDLGAWESARGHPPLARALLSHESDEWRTTAEVQQLHLLKLDSGSPISKSGRAS